MLLPSDPSGFVAIGNNIAASATLPPMCLQSTFEQRVADLQICLAPLGLDKAHLRLQLPLDLDLSPQVTWQVTLRMLIVYGVSCGRRVHASRASAQMTFISAVTANCRECFSVLWNN